MSESKQDRFETIETTGGSKVLRALPYVLAAVIAVYLLMGAYKVTQPDELSRFHYDTLGKVPVSQDGRVKPFDTVARNALLQISQKQSLMDEMLLKGEGTSDKPAVIWLAELMAGRPEAMQRRVIRIDDPGVLGLIGKTPEDGQLFSFGEFMNPPSEGAEPIYFEVGRQAERADKVRDDLRKPFDEHVIGLMRKLSLIQRLRINATPFVVPPEVQGDEWVPIVKDPREGLNEFALDRKAGQTWQAMMKALRDDNHQAFNSALQDHLAFKQDFVPAKARKAAFEQGYNRYAPFSKGIALYILAGLMGLLAMLLRPILPRDGYTALWRSGMAVLMIVFVLHTAALIVRIWLQGRPPVTNLYSSAVFIGWGIVGGAIVLEKITKLGVASLAASSAGVATLLVALHLSKDGDTMGVMQAVLDSNFWLGTHVITITLGYSATFLAGFIAICYIVFGMTTSLMDRKMARAIAGMVYAVICFALLFSFVGTVLGGIWADQSWGRFWGWDPKENGAILIVLMNAIILHARWGHLVKERGIMVLAIGGNIVTIWSWFGTNMLGVGLHAYGFMDGAWAVLTVIGTNILLLMSLPLWVPTHLWYTNYRLKHPPLLPPLQQVMIGSGLLIVGVLTTAAFLTMTLMGTLNIYYWFSAWLLLFMMAAGLGQLIEGVRVCWEQREERLKGLPASA
ncbi:MAG: cytochrome c biogenesis protein CcsA [Phycisphaeraceae bacterium]|nr:cytochrome c biogenesis protein CcsA [Phycisphaeraceae bacterium]